MGSEWDGLEMNNTMLLVCLYIGGIFPSFIFGFTLLCSVYKPLDNLKCFTGGDLIILFFVAFCPIINISIGFAGIIIGTLYGAYRFFKWIFPNFGPWLTKPLFKDKEF